MTEKNNPKGVLPMTKQKKLRHSEYYDMQPLFDKLYADSKNGKIFTKLMGIISSEENIRLAYRNIKRNGGSMTAGTDKQTIKDIETLSTSDKPAKGSLFKKKEQNSGVSSYLKNLQHSCFVCDRIATTYERYLITIFYLYKKEQEFRDLFNASKGLCTRHYSDLYKLAPEQLSGDHLTSFLTALNKIYLENMKRVRDDLDWFIDKFDYRYADEPWKNSKDALPRTIQKTNSVAVE